MKTTALYSVSVFTAMFWLFISHQTLNPITLKGPIFLQLYLIILTGFCVTVILGKLLKINNPRPILYFLISIFSLGIIKLIRGIYLGKPVGYLTVILMIEITVILFFKSTHFNRKLK
ncbi:hypothetical protein [Chryseobacterium caseinilyticum]|uniref:DUF4345 domain-containing protein n=1 Tax=Chryseobacterium caseinilyticum TaxID=2771428 RepID=A0ABR8ZE23_9FLAO|nr:hypothetical protein [Chryseobacterium caseinilyticum]MBD8083155.1 hypothetical protein [Chryseobacterium caseinilyticum]